MSTLRDTAARVAAGLRSAEVDYWADELDAAVKADVCEWTPVSEGLYKPGCQEVATLTAWRMEWFTGQGWRYCPYCGRKVKVKVTP